MPWMPRLAQMLAFAALYVQTSPAACAVESTGSADHGVIFVYHHVANDTPRSTSVTPGEFAAHLDYIAQHGYTVWPLQHLAASLRSHEPVPDNVVALTFDDAYVSVATTAHPLLKSRGWPYTVFVNTESVDAGRAPYMNWKQLQALVRDGVDIGNHAHRHAHLVHREPPESETQWQTRVRGEIVGAQQRIRAELGITPSLFAYPYGEYDSALSGIVADLDLIGLGQHSGAVGFGSDFTALPRFPVGGAYATLDRLATSLRTRPLYVRANPSGPLVMRGAHARPAIDLELVPGPYDAAQLGCYASGQGRMQLRPGRDPLRMQIQPSSALNTGRSKFNCTVAHRDEPGVFFWWSYLVMKPIDEARWYDG